MPKRAALTQKDCPSLYNYSTFFLSNPSITHVIIEPTSHDTIYINGFPTVANTKIPPCGAISVHPNNAERKPATPAPTNVHGIT